MTICSNNVAAINAALLSFRNNIQTLRGSKVTAANSNNSQATEEITADDLPEFVEPQGINNWGYIKYKSLGICYGEFTDTCTSTMYWKIRPSGLYKVYTNRNFPFTFKKVPTVLHYFDSTTLTGGGYLDSVRCAEPIVPNTSSFRIVPLTWGDSQTSGFPTANVRYHIVAIGEI